MNSAFRYIVVDFAVAAVALATGVAARGAETLTTVQMDTVSAGTVTVTSHSVAGAYGSSGYTSTRSITRTSSAPQNGYELGIGRASANACCGPNTAAAVETDSYADGGNQSRYQVNYHHSTDYSSRAFGIEIILTDD